MKKILGSIVVIGIIGLFIYVGYFLYQKNQKDPIIYKTSKAFITNIVKKTVANGSVKPRREIELKPQISGIISAIYVVAGDVVKAGDIVAKIKVIPDVVTLNNAQSTLNNAKISLKESALEKDRREKLYLAGVISETEFNQYLYQYERNKETVEAAENNLYLIREGVSKNKSATTTLVKSTISGMVLDVPVEEGEQVIQSNNFNDGTTIAFVADMSDLIFEGLVDESEVGKIKEGMNLKITIGAIESKSFKAKLEYISPKGIDDQGTIQFEIKAALDEIDNVLIRAGYSANADIILDSRDSVLAVQERDLIFEKDKLFVEVETGEQKFEKREIKTDLSDGINIEVISGINKNDKIKKQG